VIRHWWRGMGGQPTGFRACTSFLLSAMSVNGGRRAIKVHILMTKEATVVVLCMDVRCGERIPCVAHASLDVALGEGAILHDALPPDVEEGIVERREAFGCCRRHLHDFRQFLTAPIVELLQDFLFVVNGSAIEHQNERISVEGARCLCEKVANVCKEHGSINALSPLLWCIDDGWEDCLPAAACDHVEARGVFRRAGGLQKVWLAWKEDRVAVHVSLPFQSLIEEEDVTRTDALQLASHGSDLLTHVRRH